MNKVKRAASFLFCASMITSCLAVQASAANTTPYSTEQSGSSKHVSISEDSVGVFGDPIPVADNINLFRRSADGFYQQSSTGTDLDDELGTGYGVVTVNRSRDQNDLVYLEMNSNFRAAKNTEGLSRFGWEVTNTKEDQVTIMKWSPSGTKVSTVDGQQVDVNLTIPIGAGSVDIGTSFDLLTKETWLTGFADENIYSVELNTENYIEPKFAQDLSALVYYDTNLAGTHWDWRWYWTVQY